VNAILGTAARTADKSNSLGRSKMLILTQPLNSRLILMILILRWSN
jgi:hypothetical protein